MSTSARVWWIGVGALAILGAYWVGVRLLIDRDVGGAWLGYLANGAGAALGGAAMIACAPLRPTREPAAAALLAVALMTALFVGAPHAWFSWAPARSSVPWLTIVAVAAGSAGCAVAGAWAAARVIVSRVASGAAIVVLAALVTMGAVVVVGGVLLGVLGDPFDGGVATVTVFATFVVAGFLVQAVLPAPRPWTCAAGVVALFGGLGGPGRGALPARLLGAAMLVPLMYLGARLGWRWVARHRAIDDDAPRAIARTR